MKTKIKPNVIEQRLRLKPKLTKEDIKSIICALPVDKLDWRCRYLPNLLQLWYLTEFIQHSGYGLDTESDSLLKDIKELGQLAGRLGKTLAMPDGGKLRDVVFSETWGAKCITPRKNDLVKADAEIDQLILSASMIEEAANRYVAKQKRTAGRPPNVQSILVMRDIAVIYGWATETKPTRQFDELASKETGPFFNFARAFWRVIFGNEQGVTAAMRHFGSGKESEADPSALFHNLQHPYLPSLLWWKCPPK